MSTKKTNLVRIRELTLAAIFSALIIVMTVVPYLGYITYGVIEITTLHIVVILAAVCMGPKYGSVVGAVWGLSCLVRAYVAFPVYLSFGFGNFFVSVLPRILVGTVAGLVFMLLCKTKLNKLVSAGISAVCGTLTNTVLVLSSMNLWLKFKGEEYSSFFDTFKNIFSTLIGLNGIIELASAVILTVAIYKALEKPLKRLS